MTLLAVENLSVIVSGRSGPLTVVRDMSFTLARSETLGVVGESGSGKSMTALAVMGLLPEGVRATGRVKLDGENLLAANEERLCALRGNRMAMIFQEPMTALNPVHTIGDQVREGLMLHRRLDHGAATAEAVRLLERVGLPQARSRLSAYPHQLSGGQRQRVMIAMALACKPDLIVADEPTSALDVTVQAQIVALLRDVIAETGTALILISHDLAVIGQLADRVVVMYAGQAAEEGPTAALYGTRAHPYTQGLFAALPGKGARKGKRLIAIPGTVPAPDALPPGCPFHGRCPRGQQVCHDSPPPWAAYPADLRARCFFPGSGA
jgi:peptide/nickel transport system ATP-binding protein